MFNCLHCGSNKPSTEATLEHAVPQSGETVAWIRSGYERVYWYSGGNPSAIKIWCQRLALGQDVPAVARFMRVRGDGLVGYKMAIAFNGKAELAADGGAPIRKKPFSNCV